MEYLRFFRQRMAEFRALGGEVLVGGGKQAESAGEGRGAALNPLLVPFIDLNIAPLRRIYAWAVPTEAALAAIKSAAGEEGIVEVGAGTGYWAALLRRRGVDVAAYDWTPLDSCRRSTSISGSSGGSGSSGSSGSSGISSRVNGHHALPVASSSSSSSSPSQLVNVPPFTHVSEGDASMPALHPDRSLLLCWPPPEEAAAAEAATAGRGAAAAASAAEGGLAAADASEARGAEASAPGMSSLAADALQCYSGSTLVFVGELPLHLIQAHPVQSCGVSKQSHSSQSPSYKPQTAGPRFFSLLERDWTLGEHVGIPNWPGTHDCLTIWRKKGSRATEGFGESGNCSSDKDGDCTTLDGNVGSRDSYGRTTEVDSREESLFADPNRSALSEGLRQRWEDTIVGRLFLSPSIACAEVTKDVELVRAMEVEAVRGWLLRTAWSSLISGLPLLLISPWYKGLFQRNRGVV
ncbi:hypothetical protein CLOM_g19996 [Closterium sp. NIES-68]|nr:hypothetical protein CLOM_g19996 [Closterium sp. NIES-68]GJP61025.1 hypothetical protein CLOP_g18238 [Closterium sp. NIES-67]